MSTGFQPSGRRLAGLLLLSSAMVLPGAALAQGTGGPPSTGESAIPPRPSADNDLTDQVQGVDGEPIEDGLDQSDISIPGGGGAIVVTGRRIRDVSRASTQVLSVLSAEQIARTGEGNIAGALSRVTGLSIVGNGNVFVRGLGDRYSLALLNGLPLPSPQPLSRVVPLDIFPTNIVASSLVQKTYSANFPGEFGGGVINLTTRAVPTESFLRIGGGVSGDTQTTGNDGYSYYGSDIDAFGFDDGTRDAPPALQDFFDSGARLSDLGVDQAAIAKQLGNPDLVVAQRLGNLPVNFSGSITGGTGFDVFSDGRLGVIATASLSNSWRNRAIISQTAVNADLDLNTDFRDYTTDNRIVVNGLLGFGLELGEHSFRWTNLYIRDTLKQTQISVGDEFQSGFSKQIQNNGWFERQLLDTQFVGEMEFGPLEIDLRGGYAQTQREAPYEYSFEYVRTNEPNDPFGDLFVNVLDRQRGAASVTFSELKEDLYYGGLDFGYELSDWLRASVGYAYTDTDRYSERREFLFNASTDFPDGVGALRPDLLLGDAIIDYFDIGLIESTQADPAFDAGLTIHAGYGQLRVNPLDRVNLDIGVRYEDADQSVNPVELFATPTNSGSSTALANDYFLPAATLTFEASDDLQLRVAASKTIARPQFRELIFQTYYDPDTNRQFNGNPFLIDSELINAEARAEYYLGGGDRVSIAGFYKDIDNPIEAYSSFSDNAQVTSFANAPKATLYGAEVDLQYSKDLFGLGEAFATKRAVIVANYTYTKSEIKVGEGDVTQVFPRGGQPASNYFRDGAALTGQSDHLANLQLGLEDIDRLQQFTLLFSYASKRVTSRGTNALPDILENPGLSVDFVAREEADFMGVPVQLKFEARNITGRDHFEYQSNGQNRIEINTYEVGRSFALSASVEF
ncbi:TonB-dependent receptor domain-containing protein [Croceicoccus sp. YJ47]|uniref:TonB-dependent receptor domain-containing protein n=1 Tax=Croceicoccus sp. YJ47 TaxID=2798724 RepID=UPI0019242311|nr:TonB-dependent receptor [Croceicoccus sp. YJ47]QQN74464.1 TonB-dependent receptor [Croceicoccus sp. YJ47]